MSERAATIRVLHVDDESEMTDLARTFLERSDDRITVRTATDTEAAWNLLSDATVDCIVSDYDMPGESGIEFLERVREAHPDLPFILYTGKGSEEVAGEAISKGVTDYLQKETGTEQYSILANRIVNTVEKHRAQQEVETIKRRFEAVLDNTTTPMFMKDDRGEYLFVNREYRDLFGFERGDVVGRTDEDLHPPDIAEEVRANDAAVIERGESIESEERISVAGDERTFLTTKVPIYDTGTRSDSDSPVAVFGVATDITDRKRQTRRLETLISNLPGIVYRSRNEPDWPMEVVRGDCERLTGYPAEALRSGKVVWGNDVIHPDDQERMWDSVQTALDTDDPFEVTYRIRTKDGTTKWLWERGRAVDAGPGDGTVLEGFITDVTERKERERELTEITRRYQTVFDDPNILVGHLDTDGRVLDVNRTAMEYVDVTRDDVIGEPFAETPWLDHSEAAREDVREWIDRALSGEYVEFEADRVRPNGESYAVKGVFRPVTDDGEVVSLLISTRDITDYRAREAELQTQRDRYQSLFENNPLVIWEQDHSEAMAYLETISDGVDDIEEHLLEHPAEIDRLLDRVEIIDVNQNALSYYEADSKAELMNNLDSVMVEATTEVLAAQWAAFANGETEFRAETVARTLSGDRREELLQVVVPESNTEDYSRVYVIGTEITEQKERQRKLQRQNERLDEFTSVVSHDLRNPLNIASSRLELAAEECDSAHLEKVANAHDRMERLIDDLLTFARAGSEALEYNTIELRQLLAGCWEGLRTDEASLTVGTDEAIRADRGRLRQLLENLLSNAVEHGGSDVSVTVGGLPDGFYVEDDGPGIPESERTDAFEAGHSTTQEGTGFGLSIVAEVAEAHGWELRIIEGTEGGARFEITGVEFATE